MPQRNTIDELEARIVNLERRIGRYRRLPLLAIAVLGLGALLEGQGSESRALGRAIESSESQTQGVSSPLVVRDSITLVDDSGQERALLTTIDDGTSLVLFDAEGRPRIGLTAGYRTALTLYDEGSQARAILGSTSTVPSHVEQSDGTIEPAPVSSFVLFDGDGGLLGRMP